MVYQIELEVFKGPFDLLLELILKQQVDIYEVPIARITDDYLKHLSKLEEFNLELTSEFLVIAATLIELKSLALLPADETEEPLEGGAEETRQRLIGHLIDYKLFQNAATEFHRRGELKSRTYAREAQLEEAFRDIAPDVLEGVRLADLASLAQELLEIKPGFEVDTSHIYAFKVSLEQTADEVVKSLKTRPVQSFKELCAEADSKIEKIVIFLAILELFKRGEVALAQARTFGEIKVKMVSSE